LTAYRNLPTPYPMIASPTPYDVPFSHKLTQAKTTDDRQTDGRTTGTKFSNYRFMNENVIHYQ